MFNPYDEADPTLLVYDFIALADPTPRIRLTRAERAWLAAADPDNPYSVLLPDDGTDVYF